MWFLKMFSHECLVRHSIGTSGNQLARVLLGLLHFIGVSPSVHEQQLGRDLVALGDGGR